MKKRRIERLDEMHVAVRQRLTHEINYLGARAAKLDDQVAARKQPRIQPEDLRKRAKELAARLAHERESSPAPHRLRHAGGPRRRAGHSRRSAYRLRGQPLPASFTADTAARAAIEKKRAMGAVIDEQARGCIVTDVSAEKCG